MPHNAASSPPASPSPLGLLVIGRKRPGFDQEWNGIMRRRAEEALAALGFACVGGDTPVADDVATRQALDRIRAAGCDALLVLQPSIGNGQLALTVAQAWGAPLVLWATPERPDSEKVSSCSLVSQHLWASTLRQSNHPFEIVYGDPGDRRLRQEIRRAVGICRAAAKLRRAKVGLVGAHAPGFINMHADLPLLRTALGVQLQALSLPQFIDRVRGVAEAEVARDAARVRELGLPMRDVTEKDLATNSRYYLAMLELMGEESLDALAVQCWPELPNLLGQWPYLAMSRLTDDGHVIALEGDVDGALTGLMGRELGVGVSFLTDWLEHDEHTITFWHPGHGPLQLCNPAGSADGPALGQHFNLVKPLVVDAALRTDLPVTIARLWHCDGRYHLTAAEGRTIPPRHRLNGNYALVEVSDRGVPDWFDALCHAGMPHHVTLFAGHNRETFRRLARMLRVEWLA